MGSKRNLFQLRDQQHLLIESVSRLNYTFLLSSVKQQYYVDKIDIPTRYVINNTTNVIHNCPGRPNPRK